MDSPEYAVQLPSDSLIFKDNKEDQAAYLNRIRMRKGKWTEEEETYTMKLIEAFIAGVLPLPQGTTLRSYLSEKLYWYVETSYKTRTPIYTLADIAIREQYSDPMRITKKFAGSNGIGKQIFSPTLEREKVADMRLVLQREIDELEKRFFRRIEYFVSPAATIASNLFKFKPEPLTDVVVNDNGYRVALPSDSESESLLSYVELLSFISAKKLASIASNITASNSNCSDSADSFDAPMPSTRKSAISSLAARMQSLQAAKLQEDKGYFNDSYRVHGFEHLLEKKEPLLPILPKGASTQLSLALMSLTKASRAAGPAGVAKLKAAQKREPKEPKAPRYPKVPKRDLGGMSMPSLHKLPKKKAKLSKDEIPDTSADIQASTLLLDFFRAAREKEASQSEGDSDSAETKNLEHEEDQEDEDDEEGDDEDNEFSRRYNGDRAIELGESNLYSVKIVSGNEV